MNRIITREAQVEGVLWTSLGLRGFRDLGFRI